MFHILPCSFAAAVQDSMVDYWIQFIQPFVLTPGIAPPSPPPPFRFSAVVQGGVITSLNLESTGEMSCSLSNQILGQLKQ
jgi:hypothetical protein